MIINETFNTSEIVSLLGLTIDDKKLIEGLEKNGIKVDEIKHEPKPDYFFFKEINEGFSLGFSDAAMYLLEKENDPVGNGPFFFTSLFLYSDGKEGYSQFKSEIPFDLHFSDTRNDIIKKLGDVSWQRKRNDNTVVADRWDNSENRLHITYYKESELPSVILIFVPNEDEI